MYGLCLEGIVSQMFSRYFSLKIERKITSLFSLHLSANPHPMHNLNRV